jgi:hypothetical protein
VLAPPLPQPQSAGDLTQLDLGLLGGQQQQAQEVATRPTVGPLPPPATVRPIASVLSRSLGAKATTCGMLCHVGGMTHHDRIMAAVPLSARPLEMAPVKINAGMLAAARDPRP